MPDRTFDLLQRWDAWMEVSGDINEVTRTQYRRSVLSFLACVLKPLDEITEDDIVAVLAEASPRGGHRENLLRALHSFYRWAARRGELTDVTTGLRIRKARPGPARVLSDPDLAKLLVAAERVDPRARPTLELMYCTGARIGSMEYLQPEDITFDPPRIYFRHAKNDAPYAVPLGPRGEASAVVLLRLRHWSPRKSPGRRDNLIGVGKSSIWKWCHDAADLAGVKANPHLLRHTFASKLAADPAVPVAVIRELMNWQDLSQWRRYVSVADTDLRRAVEVL